MARMSGPGEVRDARMDDRGGVDVGGERGLGGEAKPVRMANRPPVLMAGVLSCVYQHAGSRRLAQRATVEYIACESPRGRRGDNCGRSGYRGTAVAGCVACSVVAPGPEKRVVMKNFGYFCSKRDWPK